MKPQSNQAHQAPTQLKRLPPNTPYTLEWWNIDQGVWSTGVTLQTDNTGHLVLPQKPDDNGWAFRIRFKED